MQVELIGPFRLSAGHGPIVLPGPRPIALFSMLALADGGAVAREMLIDRFWGDRPEAQAAASLRQTLYALRQALGPEGGRIASQGAHVRLDLAGATVDALEEAALPEARPRALRAALAARARRELLEGLALSAPGVEDWLRLAREGWRNRAAAALRASVAAAFEEGDWDGARALAETLHGLDPFCEEAVAALLRLDARGPGAAAAERRFRAFEARLREELGIAPSETVAELARAAGRSGPVRGRPERPAFARAPAAEIVWPEPPPFRPRPGPAEEGLAGAARTILAEELGALGIRTFLATPDLPVPAGAFLVRGSIVPFPDAATLLMEVVAPGREILHATRMRLRWPLDLDAFETGIAERARMLGAAVLRHAGPAEEDAAGPEAVAGRLSALHAAMAGAAALAAEPAAAGEAVAAEVGPAEPAAGAPAAGEPAGIGTWTEPNLFLPGTGPVTGLPGTQPVPEAPAAEADQFRFGPAEPGPVLAAGPGTPELVWRASALTVSWGGVLAAERGADLPAAGPEPAAVAAGPLVRSAPAEVLPAAAKDPYLSAGPAEAAPFAGEDVVRFDLHRGGRAETGPLDLPEGDFAAEARATGGHSPASAAVYLVVAVEIDAGRARWEADPGPWSLWAGPDLLYG